MLTLKNLNHIFRAYDIRGHAEQELTPNIAYQIGLGIGKLLLSQNRLHITVSYDGRLSSPGLSKAIIAGLSHADMTITDVGCGPTPYLYFCDRYLNSDAAIMITGSHNAGHINGLKIVVNHQPFWGDDIQLLYTQLIQQADVSYDINHEPTAIKQLDLRDNYIDYINADYNQHYPVQHNLKIVWDPGNGASGEIVSRLIKRIPGQHLIINENIDGHFPNHHPDPTLPENLEQLIEAVKQTKSDFGIAFDGDADRIGVVTSQGQILYGEHLLELLAPEVLTNHPGAVIIADVKTTQHFIKKITALGGVPLLWKTGHSAIKAKMHEMNSPFAAEMSGHIFFADRYFGYDDGIYTALRLIGVLSQNHITLDAWLSKRPQFYTTPELRIECEAKFEVMHHMESILKQQGKPFLNIDGIRVDEATGWWMIRASNTQELIVVRAESTSQNQILQYILTIIELLQAYDIDLNDLIKYKDLLTY